jgi:hypothetical protein
VWSGDHRREHRLDPLDLVATGVEGDDVGAPSGRLEGVSAEATSQVEDLVAPREAQLVVVGREHQSKSIDSGSGRPVRIAS